MSFPLDVFSFKKGDHICLSYRDWQDQISTSAPYVELGLNRRERCFCILPENRQDSLLEALKDRGIDARMEVERGALVLVSPEQTYLCDGTFHPVAMTELLTANVEEALSLGFEGFRAMGDMSWAVQRSSCSALLPEYEAIMKQFFPQRPALGLCMYDTRIFNAWQLRELMDLHQTALSSPDPSRRAIRLREGKMYGDIIFDAGAPSVFDYSVQEDDSTRLIASGQESSLTVALAIVKRVLSDRATNK